MNEQQTLSQRKVSRLVPHLEDLLFEGAQQYAEQRPQVAFNGFINILLMNNGIDGLVLSTYDFDQPYGTNQMTVTGTFIHAPDGLEAGKRKMGLVVDVTFNNRIKPDEPELVS